MRLSISTKIAATSLSIKGGWRPKGKRKTGLLGWAPRLKIAVLVTTNKRGRFNQVKSSLGRVKGCQGQGYPVEGDSSQRGGLKLNRVQNYTRSIYCAPYLRVVIIGPIEPGIVNYHSIGSDYNGISNAPACRARHP